MSEYIIMGEYDTYNPEWIEACRLRLEMSNLRESYHRRFVKELLAESVPESTIDLACPDSSSINEIIPITVIYNESNDYYRTDE